MNTPDFTMPSGTAIATMQADIERLKEKVCWE
jgi:hypothetical protein